MSFNIGSVFNSVIPALSQAAIMGIASSSPQGMLFTMFLSGQGSSMAGSPFSQGFEALRPFISSALEKLAGLGAATATGVMANAGTVGSSGTAAADNSQARIQSILNGPYSIEEKIILIAGVVSESVTGELEECLKEQGKLAKSTSGTTGQATSAASSQNVENRIQILMQRLNQMQTLASNMIQAMHTTKKASIQNIRV